MNAVAPLFGDAVSSTTAPQATPVYVPQGLTEHQAAVIGRLFGTLADTMAYMSAILVFVVLVDLFCIFECVAHIL